MSTQKNNCTENETKCLVKIRMYFITLEYITIHILSILELLLDFLT